MLHVEARGVELRALAQQLRLAGSTLSALRCCCTLWRWARVARRCPSTCERDTLPLANSESRRSSSASLASSDASSMASERRVFSSLAALSAMLASVTRMSASMRATARR